VSTYEETFWCVETGRGAPFPRAGSKHHELQSIGRFRGQEILGFLIRRRTVWSPSSSSRTWWELGSTDKRKIARWVSEKKHELLCLFGTLRKAPKKTPSGQKPPNGQQKNPEDSIAEKNSFWYYKRIGL
jgi:hypothetical protein